MIVNRQSDLADKSKYILLYSLHSRQAWNTIGRYMRGRSHSSALIVIEVLLEEGSLMIIIEYILVKGPICVAYVASHLLDTVGVSHFCQHISLRKLNL